MCKVIDFAAVRAAKGLTPVVPVQTTAVPSTSPAPGIHGYHPEMGEVKPNCQIEASLSHYGKHYFIDTPLQLSGRGIELLRTYKPSDLTPQGQRKVGWHQYKVTLKAYEALRAKYSIGYEMLLD